MMMYMRSAISRVPASASRSTAPGRARAAASTSPRASRSPPCVGQIVCRPWLLRTTRPGSGSRIRAITFGTLNRRLRDLGDDDVRVVAVGRRRRRRRRARSRPPSAPRSPAPCPTVNWPPGVLPRLVEPDLQPRVRLGVLVEAGDLVALGASSARERRADPARSDDEDEHRGGMLRADRRASARPSPRRARRRAGIRRGGAVSSTRQGALREHVLGHLPDLRPGAARRSRRGPPRPGSGVGGSAPITITSTPRSRAASHDPGAHRRAPGPPRCAPRPSRTPRPPPWPARAPGSAASARSSGGGESSGTVSGRSTT